MLEVDQLSNGGFERLPAQIPGGAPRELAVREVGQLGHLLQAEVASLSEDRGVQVRDQVLRAGLGTTSMLKSAGKADPAIDLNHELGQVNPR